MPEKFQGSGENKKAEKSKKKFKNPKKLKKPKMPRGSRKA